MVGSGKDGPRTMMRSVGLGQQQVKNHFVEVTAMVDVGQGGQQVQDHFVEVTKMIEIGKGVQRVTMHSVGLGGQPTSSAPKGHSMPAQGNALGKAIAIISSPEGAGYNEPHQFRGVTKLITHGKETQP